MANNSSKTNDHHCRKMTSVFSDYLDQRLKKQLCRRLEVHMAECPDCKLYFDTLKRTVTLYRTMEQEEIPSGVEKRLFATIKLACMSKRTVGPEYKKKMNPETEVRHLNKKKIKKDKKH